MAGTKKSTQSDDATAEDEPAPQEAAAPQTSNPNEPRPWRVETFSEGGQWGWRLAAANGTVIRDSGATFDDREAAISAAEGEDFEGVTVLDRRAQPVRRGW